MMPAATSQSRIRMKLIVSFAWAIGRSRSFATSLFSNSVKPEGTLAGRPWTTIAVASRRPPMPSRCACRNETVTLGMPAK